MCHKHKGLQEHANLLIINTNIKGNLLRRKRLPFGLSKTAFDKLKSHKTHKFRIRMISQKVLLL